MRSFLRGRSNGRNRNEPEDPLATVMTTKLSDPETFFSFAIGDATCMVSGIDALINGLNDPNDETKKDALWMVNKLITSRESENIILNNPDMAKRISLNMLDSLKSHDREISFLALKGFLSLARRTKVAEMPYIDEICEIMMKALSEEIHFQDMVIDLALEFFGYMNPNDIKFKDLVHNPKLPSRITHISKGYQRYLKENPRIMEYFLNLLNRAHTNPALFHDESTAKAIWTAIFIGPPHIRRCALEILSKTINDIKVTEVLMNYLPISDMNNYIESWKNEPELLAEILKALITVSSRHEKKLAEKIKLHLSFLKEVMNLLELLPDDYTLFKSKEGFYDVVILAFDLLSIMTIDDKLRLQMQNYLIADILKKISAKRLDDKLKTALFKFLSAHCHYYNDYDICLQKNLLQLISLNISPTNETLSENVIDFLMRAADAGYPVKKKVGIEGLLNLDNLYQTTTNQKLKDKLKDLKILMDSNLEKRERREPTFSTQLSPTHSTGKESHISRPLSASKDKSPIKRYSQITIVSQSGFDKPWETMTQPVPPITRPISLHRDIFRPPSRKRSPDNRSSQHSSNLSRLNNLPTGTTEPRDKRIMPKALKLNDLSSPNNGIPSKVNTIAEPGSNYSSQAKPYLLPFSRKESNNYDLGNEHQVYNYSKLVDDETANSTKHNTSLYEIHDETNLETQTTPKKMDLGFASSQKDRERIPFKPAGRGRSEDRGGSRTPNLFADKIRNLNELLGKDKPTLQNLSSIELDRVPDNVILPQIGRPRNFDNSIKKASLPRITKFPFSHLEGIDQVIADNYYNIDFTKKNFNSSRLLRHYMKIGIPEATGIQHLTGATTVEELLTWFINSLQNEDALDVIANLQRAIGSSARTAFVVCVLIGTGQKKGFRLEALQRRLEEMSE